MESYRVSVVVPTYNSAKWIAGYLTELSSFLSGKFVDYEVLVVNDTSKDHTLEILNRLGQSDPKLYIIDLAAHLGQQNATWRGIKKAKGDLIITIDDDGEFPPDQIARLFERWEQTGADIVYGIPSHIKKGGGASIFFYKLYLKNLERKGEKRKSSFRLITAESVRTLNIENINNIDIYLSVHNRAAEYTTVDYKPAGRNHKGRYGFMRYLIHFIKIVYYKKMIINRKDVESPGNHTNNR